jgi:hypothetical protein
MAVTGQGGLLPVATRSKASIYGRSLAGIVGSNPAGNMDFFFSCECGVSLCWSDHSSRGIQPNVVCLECDRKTSIMRRPWPTRARNRMDW